jgi:hypothetical protein
MASPPAGDATQCASGASTAGSALPTGAAGLLQEDRHDRESASWCVGKSARWRSDSLLLAGAKVRRGHVDDLIIARLTIMELTVQRVR